MPRMSTHLAMIVTAMALAACGSTPWPDPVTAHISDNQPDARPHDNVVIVAIEDYEHLPDIRGAVANAWDWSRYFREERRVAPDRIQLVTDGRATREGITAALRTAVEGTDGAGRIWFVFIGHGTARRERTREGRHEGLLVAVDARRTTESIEGNSISQAAVARLLADREHVVLLDACFSGTSRKNAKFVADLSLIPVDLDTVPSGVLLTAARNDETAALLSKSLRPGFSLAALGAMQGWCEGRYGPADGRITGDEVTRCAHEIIGKVNRDKHSPQLIATGQQRELTLAEGIRPGYDFDGMIQGVIDAGPPARSGPMSLIIAGSVGLAVGIGAHVVNRLDQNELDGLDLDTERAVYNELRLKLDSSYYTAVAGYAVGGLALAGGIAWRVALLGEDEDWLAISPTGSGLVWGGRF